MVLWRTAICVGLQVLTCLLISGSAVGNKQTYTILEGEHLLVICNATDLNDTEVFWTRNSSDSTFYEEGKRLDIPDIDRSYSGEYICHGRNTSFSFREFKNDKDGNETILVILVDVQYPAEINLFSINKVTVLENENFSVSCDIEGNPSPLWTLWNKDTGRVLAAKADSANFTLSDLMAHCDTDNGYWEITGANELNKGENVTRGANLTVNCPPRPLFDQNTYLVSSVLRESASLIMNLVSRPQATFAWAKDDGTDISKFSTQTDELNRTTLNFPNVNIETFGNYTLRMENIYGTYYAQYTLQADGPPETPTDLQYSDVTYNSAKLHWKSGFDMGSKQHFLIMEAFGNGQYIQMSNEIYDNSDNHGVNQTWTHVLKGLVSETYYNLSVLSLNERGYTSQLAEPVGFTTKKFSDNLKNGSDHVTLIVGLVLGTIGTVGMVLFIIYIYKYKTRKAQYVKY